MNYLYYGDNLDVLRQHVADESVDLVYLDPPFNSNATYNVLFAEQDGSRAAAQIRAFGDTWRWDQAAVRTYQAVVESGGEVARAMKAFRDMLGDANMTAYLAMMSIRLVELHRVLKPHGSLYLHCDPTASHYLKVVLDAVFGTRGFQNEVIWHHGLGAFQRAKGFPSKHDVLLFYTKNPDFAFNKLRGAVTEAMRKKYAHRDEGGWYMHSYGKKYYLKGGKPLDDVWDIPALSPTAKERLGYPTQKPEALLDRIVQASSNEGDVVLDPFCGCGTTVVSAQKHQRRWIGIDITHLAVGLMRHRLQDTFGQTINDSYEVIGEPTSIPDAEYLAEQDRYQFEAWALGLVGARRDEKKKGADRGIDGVLYFHDERGATQKVVLSVKSGQAGVLHMRDLRAVVEREEAAIGALLMMREPTRPMRAEAAGLGYYESPWGKHPRLQVLTIAELLAGGRIDMPPLGMSVTYKRAPRARPQAAEEQPLFEGD